MQNKSIWKILAISIALLMVISCATPCIAVDDNSTNNASNTSNEMKPFGPPPPHERMGEIVNNRTDYHVSDSNVSLSSAAIYVPDDYSTIQSAVNAASPGDTIIVRDGIYVENINVNKRLTICSENGADFTIIQAENSDDCVFWIFADYVNISGFTVEGATGGYWLEGTYYRVVGIYVIGAEHCNVFDNIAYDNYFGFCLGYFSNNNTITNNNASSNTYGISFWYSSNNNILVSNNAFNNGRGIGLVYSSINNTITNNRANNNTQYGIYSYSSSNNTIYLNNHIDNNDNFYSYNSTNIWNSPEQITYTYKGNTYTNYLGNYWDDYLGSDADGDGIGDTPYNIDLDNDSCPLMERFENYFVPTLPPTTPDYFFGNWVEKVINWASKQEGKDYWKEYCMAFVSDTFKVCENRPASANVLRNDFENAGKFYSKENNWDPPRGSLVFFSGTGKYASYGHIGISLGDRKVIHAYQTVREETIMDIEGLSYIDSYLGWAYPPEEWFSPKISNTFKKGDIVYKKEGWNLRDIPSLHGKILSTAGGNGEIIEDEWNGICNAGYYWWNITFGDYEGWCAEEGLDQPPVCAIELRKEGVGINEIDVGEFFDIYVGDSTDDTGIREVRFSSDDSQDGNPTGEWTEWYDWDTSSGDWNAETKIKKWSFAIGGKKEVWAEVKDNTDQISNCSANIYATLVQKYAPNMWFGSTEHYFPISPFFYTDDIYETSGGKSKAKYLRLTDDQKWDNFTIFYHIAETEDEIVYEYWFYYAYNDFRNIHFHDWETVYVFADKNTEEVTRVVASAHGDWIQNNEYFNPQFGEDEHAGILVEEGSHASCTDRNNNGLFEPITDVTNLDAYGILFWTEEDQLNGCKIKYSDLHYTLKEINGNFILMFRGLDTFPNSPELGWRVTVPIFGGDKLIPVGGKPPTHPWYQSRYYNPEEIIPILGNYVGGTIHPVDGGIPIGAIVVILSDDHYYTFADENGNFLINNVSSGVHEVVVNLEGYAPHKQRFIHSSNTTVGVDGILHLIPESEAFRIEGSVTDVEGKVVANAKINVYDASGTKLFTTLTDEDGTYLVMVSEKDVYTVEALTDTKVGLTKVSGEAGGIVKANIIVGKGSIVAYIDRELQELINEVTALDINLGIKNSLIKKLENARSKNDQALDFIKANNMLNSEEKIINAFISEVEAQSEKEIAEEDAAKLKEKAMGIRALIQLAMETPI